MPKERDAKKLKDIYIREREEDKYLKYNLDYKAYLTKNLRKKGYKANFDSVNGLDYKIPKLSEEEITSLIKKLEAIQDKKVIRVTQRPINVSEDELYFFDDALKLEGLSINFIDMNVVIPIHYLSAFIYSKVNYLYNKDESGYIINILENKEDDLNLNLYPYQKDYYNFLQPYIQEFLY